VKKPLLLVLALGLFSLAADSRQTAPGAETCESPQVISAVSAIYPQVAIKVHVVGTVPVNIEINENGDVVVATPSGGPGMLQAASKSAATRWRFQSTGKRETGRLLFKFVLFASDNDPRDSGDAFFPPCKVEVRRSLPQSQTIY
jgi:TonB family protein